MWVIFAVESTVVGVMGCQSNKALHERIFLMHLLHPILEITVTPGQANYPLIKMKLSVIAKTGMKFKSALLVHNE